MKIYVEKRMMGKTNYPKLIEKFPMVEFVDNLDENEDVEAMIIMNSTLNKLDLDKYLRLRWIQLLMAGYDNVDINYIKSKRILVTNARDIFSTSIAEDVISKILYFNRNMKYYQDCMYDKVWNPISKEPEIFNSTVAILGSGSIGKELAKRFKAFGVNRIYGYKKSKDKPDNFDEVFNDEEGLDQILKLADYVIVALPLTKDTKKLINEERLQLLKQNALIINVARGDIIDQQALIKCLKQKQIRGAGLDVTTPEPLPKDSELWNLDNVYITPHNASSSPYMKNRLFELTLVNLERFLSNSKLKYLI